MTIASPLRFSERFLRIAGLAPCFERGIMSRTKNKQPNEKDLGKTQFLSNFILELALIEYNFIKYSPSELAASALFVAMKFTHQDIK